ncbi:PQQ-binding-like beta-propeller repeat protein [Crateriforma conspicua]|uniref:Outer membrane biogenesis protein BamB n=1 Tax=Crateriforma conspicua TaxID=2527996 RepID=A0A5C6FWN7_9PLAN|nr:PQQ-binding-like beta-propeller repeat protein [Crateriforma conspicua]TWU65433.1 outer membrane biogenesis protein BamB [Crateriforma conspicua]
MSRTFPRIFGVWILLFHGALAWSDDWQQFRGDDGSATSSQGSLPVQWDAATSVRWKTDLPGPGGSCPIVLDDLVVVTYYDGYGIDEDSPGDLQDLSRHLAAYRRSTGDHVWTVDFPSDGGDKPFEGFQALHGYASSTPVTDGQDIYVFLGCSGVAAVSKDGQKRWQVSVGDGVHGWGSGTSPVLFDDLVIVNASVESGSMVALNKSDGTEAWRVDDVQRSWSSPLLVDVGTGTQELVLADKGRLRGFDPSTGKTLWTCPFVDDYICPTPISHDGIVYAIGGRRNTAVAVKAGGRGDVEPLWEARAGANVPSPVYHDGHLYFLNERSGLAFCLNAEDGEIVYRERLSPRPGTVYGSPLLAEDQYYVVTRDSGTFVIAAQPEFQMLQHNDALDDSRVNASPVPAGSEILVRSNDALYCLQ